MTDWRARVLEAVDADALAMERLLAELVRVPSVSGSGAENDLQARLATILRGEGLYGRGACDMKAGLGTFAMLARGWRADACVIPEPTGLHLVPATAGAPPSGCGSPAAPSTPPAAPRA